MKKSRVWLVVGLLMLLMHSCDKSEDIIAPSVKTHEVTISRGSHTLFSFTGELTGEGDRAIVSKGFCYAVHSSPGVGNSTVIEFASFYGFFARAEENLLPNTTYFVRAFVKTDDEQIHYGNAVQFTSFSGAWKQLASFPGPHRRSSIIFTVNNRAFVVGGISLESAQYNDVWCYDPTINHWTEKSDFPATSINAEMAASFVIADTAYVISSNRIWLYDPIADDWKEKERNSPQQTNMIAFSLDGKGYVGSGYINGGFYQYDPDGNSWTIKRRYPGEATYHYYSLSVSGKGYAGYGQNSFKRFTNEFYEYNPATDTWTKKASFVQFDNFRNGMICFTAANRIFFGMGRNINNFDFADLYEYTAGAWRDVSSMPGTQRSNAVSFSLNGKGYVGLGHRYYNGGQIDKLMDFWEFTP